MARLPDGALMARAANGLAVECAQLLGGSYGSRVVLLVGAGNNGGDALYAGAALARRGAEVRAVLLAPDRAHAGGLAALRRAGGRVVAADPGAARRRRSRGRRHRRDRRAAAGCAARRSSSPTAARDRLTVAVDVPSGVSPDTGEGRRRAIRADVTVTFGALKAGLVAGAGVARAGELRLVDIGLGATLPAARTLVLEGRRRRRAAARPGRGRATSTPAASSGWSPARSAYPGAGVLATGAAISAAPDTCATRAPPPTRSGPGTPRSSCRTAPDRASCGCRPGWSARASGTDDAARDLLADVLAPTCR